MRKWFACLSLACTSAIASAQVDAPVPVPVQKVQVAPAQALPVQVQIQIAPGAQMEVVRAVRADMIMPSPNRLIGQADAVFVGRVIAIEPMDVEAPQVANGPKVTYRVAVVQVSDPVFGLKKDTQQVRIAFIVQPNAAPLNGPNGGVQILPVAPPGQPQIQPFPGRRPFPGIQQMNLTVGQDGLFTVSKHHKENFYLAANYQHFTTRQDNPGFEAQVKTAKQLAKVMGDPVAALKTDDRYTAAALLISKYRNPNNTTGQPMKLVAIDAAESQLILKALAGGDWKQTAYGLPIPAPFELFNQLGITQMDGLVQGRTQPEVYSNMQKWLDENNGKYLIQKYVVDPNAKPGVQPGVVPGIRPGIQPLPPIRIQPGQVQPLPAPIQDLPANPAPKQDR
ncbi:MAG: hypothetical protein HY289_00635 [Planctomycetes bacterium]|nr:hypothetical protein [Planctomycetota bacterium]